MSEQHGPLNSSSSHEMEPEEAQISQYEVSSLIICFHKVMSVQHKLSLANHEKDEVVKALCIAEVCPNSCTLKSFI